MHTDTKYHSTAFEHQHTTTTYCGQLPTISVCIQSTGTRYQTPRNSWCTPGSPEIDYEGQYIQPKQYSTTLTNTQSPQSDLTQSCNSEFGVAARSVNYTPEGLTSQHPSLQSKQIQTTAVQQTQPVTEQHMVPTAQLPHWTTQKQSEYRLQPIVTVITVPQSYVSIEPLMITQDLQVDGMSE